MTKGAGTNSGAVTVTAAGPLRGEVSVPGDKSISHRAVLLGSIATGETVVENFLEGRDNMSTLRAFEAMGVRFRREGGGRLTVGGVGLRGLAEPGDVIDAGNSGTTARLLTGLLAGQHFFSVITGDASLRRRPMGRVVTPLRSMGAAIEGRRGGELLPLAVSGRPLRGMEYAAPVASAQLKSSLLLAGLTAEGVTAVTEPMKSRDHTERFLARFGADIEVDGLTVRVRGGRELTGCEVTVPGDISSAAFLLVAALITPGSDLLVRNVGVNPTRTGILDILGKMGARIETSELRDEGFEPSASIRARTSKLHGAAIGGAELLPAIDEFPVICVAAALAEGVTVISGASELRVKESDRIAVMASALSSLGVKVEERSDGLVIEGVGSGRGALGHARIDSRGDHRVAMAMAVAGLASPGGVTIDDADCADVSFPGFFDLLEEIGG
ncbi:MAG TPA: 3-phosphoshikimate 1-carboxyvinyltransferase [Deltaproteobacteria bacterium]|nr:3-phosphoshikimate 1-carboxyvinyltransferase [Deltaproteobacteria bacterium]